jgi:hypothetical protein
MSDSGVLLTVSQKAGYTGFQDCSSCNPRKEGAHEEIFKEMRGEKEMVIPRGLEPLLPT